MSAADLRLLLDDGPVGSWSERWAAEAPFFAQHLVGLPKDRLLDLGCGTGEHARRFAERGFEVVAVDASRERLDRAEAAAGPLGGGSEGPHADGNPRWIQGEMGAVEALVRGHYGAAVVLGNSLAHILGAESLSRMLVGLRRRLLPGAPLVIHQHNYDRIYARRIRHLPTATVATPEGDRLGVRLLDPRDDGYVVFTAALLDHRPESENPVTISATYSMHLRGWLREELDAALSLAQFSNRQFFGGFDESPFEEMESAELVCVAR